MAVGFMLTAMTMLTALTAQAAEYGIKFDGQSVTDANKNDLTASITSIMSGTATYNSETKTLSLTDVMIDGSSGPVLQIDQDELTIEVTGDCQLMTMNGVGLVINDSHVTLTGRGTLSISGEDGVYLAKEQAKLTVQGPTLVATGFSMSYGSGYGIHGYETPYNYYGELELKYGTIQATGYNDGMNYYGSICNLGAITVYENATLVQPANAEISAHDVHYKYSAYVLTETVVIEAPMPDVETPLTFEAIGDATVTIDNPLELNIGYSVNAGETTWQKTTTISISLSKGSKVELFGNNAAYCNNSQSKFTTISFNADCYVYGNMMSLISSTGYKTLKTLTAESALADLFWGNTHVKSHPKRRIVLPALTLTEGCYFGLFNGCTAMTTAPELPATTLAPNCYMAMFCGCMSLLEAPALPATTLQKNCYYNMFMNCSSLTKSPELRAEKLVNSCYGQMFSGCENMSEITCLAKNISASNCTASWVSDVSPAGTFIKDAEFDGWTTGKDGIPSKWTVQDDNSKQPCGLAFSKDHIDVTYGEVPATPALSNPHGLPVNYSSSNEAVVTVDSQGNLTPQDIGTATITASFAGSTDYYSGQASYTVTVTGQGKDPELAFNREVELVSYGKTIHEPVLTKPDGLTVTYTCDNPKVIDIDPETGKVLHYHKGVVTITATTKGNKEYASGSAYYHLVIIDDAEKARCDANADGNVTITDAVTVVNYIENH